MWYRASSYRMGIDDRQEHHPTQASASLPLVIREDGGGRRLSEAPLIPQDSPSSRSLLDQPHPTPHTGIHMQQPRQPWKHPSRMERRCDAPDRDLPTVKADQREDVRDDEPQPRPCLTAEELGRPEHIQMETDKLSPGRGLLPLGRWGNPMAF